MSGAHRFSYVRSIVKYLTFKNIINKICTIYGTWLTTINIKTNSLVSPSIANAACKIVINK